MVATWNPLAGHMRPVGRGLDSTGLYSTLSSIIQNHYAVNFNVKQFFRKVQNKYVNRDKEFYLSTTTYCLVSTRGLIYKTVVKSLQVHRIFVINQQVTMS